MVRHRPRLCTETVDAPSLGTSKARLDEAPSNLVLIEVDLITPRTQLVGCLNKNKPNHILERTWSLAPTSMHRAKADKRQP